MVSCGYAFRRNYVVGLIVYLGSGDQLSAMKTLSNFSPQNVVGGPEEDLP